MVPAYLTKLRSRREKTRLGKMKKYLSDHKVSTLVYTSSLMTAGVSLYRAFVEKDIGGWNAPGIATLLFGAGTGIREWETRRALRKEEKKMYMRDPYFPKESIYSYLCNFEDSVSGRGKVSTLFLEAKRRITKSHKLRLARHVNECLERTFGANKEIEDRPLDVSVKNEVNSLPAN